MSFNEYLAVLDRPDNQLPSASIPSKPKLDPIAASAQELAAHIDQLYQFNENHKLNGKDKDGPELMSLSLLNVLAEMVNIPFATSERIASTAAKSHQALRSEDNSPSGDTGSQPDDRAVNQALPLLTRAALKLQGFAISYLPMDKGNHFGGTGRPLFLNESTKRGFRRIPAENGLQKES
jgi:hypothetical protein